MDRIETVTPAVARAAPPENLAALRRIGWLRWLVLAACAAAVLLIPPLLSIPLPVPPMLAVVIVAAIWNTVSGYRLRRADAAGAGAIELAVQLCFDIIVLGALLFFSGGATNPLISLLLPPVAMAALSLPARQVAMIAGLAVAVYSSLTFIFVPLALADAERATQLHLGGMWLTFVVSVALIAWLILRAMMEIRSRDAQLAAAREQTARDERLVALGALAAGAAHELGTPLATMAVLAGEIDRDARLGADARADLHLLREQIAHCKRIITDMAERSGARRVEAVERVQADTWLRSVLADWQQARNDAPATLAMLEKVGASDTPMIAAEPTLAQGVVNLLNNAARAGVPVSVRLGWNETMLFIEIQDSGSGFAEAVLHEGGHTQFPAHAGGSGIGLLLARGAIERLGGQLLLSNRPEVDGGGAQARIELPLARIAP